MSRRLNKRGKALLGAIVGTVMLLIPSVAMAKDAIGSRIEIEKIDGTAYVIDTNGNKADARTGVKLSNGESLQTAEDSYIYLSLDDSKVIELDELSEVKVNKSGKKLKLQVEEGSLFFEVKEKLADDESMNIDASTMSMSIRGTAGVVSLRRVNGEVTSMVDLLEGRVDMAYSDTTGEAREFTLWGGETLAHTDGDPGVYRDLIDITELRGFAAKAIQEDPELAAKILAESGLNSEYVSMHADEMLKKSHEYNVSEYSGVFEPGQINAVRQGGTDTENKGAATAKAPAGDKEPAAVQTAAVVEPAKGDMAPTKGGTAPAPQPAGGTYVVPDSGSTGDDSSDGGDDGDGRSHSHDDDDDSDDKKKSKVTVKFYARTDAESENYTVISEQTLTKGAAIMNIPTVENWGEYEFSGWDPAVDEYADGNKEYFAQYKKSSPVVKWLVRFLNWDDSVIRDGYVQDGGTAEPPESTPSREGYTFTGWSPDPSAAITADTDFKAQFEENPSVTRYTVIFSDGYGTTLKEETVDSGASATPPENPVREGCTFTGWDGDYTNVTSDRTVYAVWEEDPEPVTWHTVLFIYVKGGSSVYSISCKIMDGESAASEGETALDTIREKFSEVPSSGCMWIPNTDMDIDCITGDVTFRLEY